MVDFPESDKASSISTLTELQSQTKRGLLPGWLLRLLGIWKFRLRYDGLTALLYAVLAIPLLAPIASSTTILPKNGDTVNQLTLLVQAKQALDEGQFPIRVAPFQVNGWRLPEFQFYGQLPHTIGALLYRYLTPANPYIAYVLVYWLALFLGGFFTYRIGYWLTHNRVAAVLAGALYMTAPYFLINILVRSAFTEVVAQGLIPVVLYTSLRSYARPGIRSLLAAGVCWSLLAITHLITFVYFSIFSFLLIGFFVLVKPSKKRSWLRAGRVALAYILGCSLAAFFLAPLFLTHDSLLVSSILGSPFSWNWLTSLPRLLSNR